MSCPHALANPPSWDVIKRQGDISVKGAVGIIGDLGITCQATCVVVLYSRLHWIGNCSLSFLMGVRLTRPSA